MRTSLKWEIQGLLVLELVTGGYLVAINSWSGAWPPLRSRKKRMVRASILTLFVHVFCHIQYTINSTSGAVRLRSIRYPNNRLPSSTIQNNPI